MVTYNYAVIRHVVQNKVGENQTETCQSVSVLIINESLPQSVTVDFGATSIDTIKSGVDFTKS